LRVRGRRDADADWWRRYSLALTRAWRTTRGPMARTRNTSGGRSQRCWQRRRSPPERQPNSRVCRVRGLGDSLLLSETCWAAAPRRPGVVPVAGREAGRTGLRQAGMSARARARWHQAESHPASFTFLYIGLAMAFRASGGRECSECQEEVVEEGVFNHYKKDLKRHAHTPWGDTGAITSGVDHPDWR